MGLVDSAGKRLEPSFRLPLVRIFSPGLFVAVARFDVRDNEHTLSDGNDVDERAVEPANGCGEGQLRVFADSGGCWVSNVGQTISIDTRTF